MNKEEKILRFIEDRYKKKLTLKTKIFKVIDIDSFEFVKLISQIQNMLKKKYKPVVTANHMNTSLKKFLTYFK